MKLSDKTWLAGFLEGEGCFAIDRKKYVSVRATSTDLDVLKKAANLMNARVYPLRGQQNATINKRSFRAIKPAWQAYVYGDDAIKLMKLVHPYMGNRRSKKIASILQGPKIGPGPL